MINTVTLLDLSLHAEQAGILLIVFKVTQSKGKKSTASECRNPFCLKVGITLWRACHSFLRLHGIYFEEVETGWGRWERAWITFLRNERFIMGKTPPAERQSGLLLLHYHLLEMVSDSIPIPWWLFGFVTTWPSEPPPLAGRAHLKSERWPT